MSRLRTVPPKKPRLEPGHDSTTSTSTQTPSNNLTKKTVERLECVLIPAWDKDRTRPRAIDTAVDKQDVKDGDLTLAATNRSLIPITAATLSELQPPSQSKSAPRVLHGWWIEKKHALGKVPECESWVVLHGHVLEPRKMNGFPAGWKATLMRLLNETSIPITDTLNNTNITTVRISKPPILAGSEDMQVAAQHTIRWTTPTVKPRWSPTPGHFYLSAVEIPILPKRPRRSKPPIVNSADKSDKDHDERASRRQQRKSFTTTSHSRRSASDARSRQHKSGQLLETKQEDTATPAMGMSNSLVPRTLRSRRADTSHALLHSRSTGGHPDRERSESNVDPDLRPVDDTYDDDLLYEIKHAEEHVDVARHGYLDLGDVGTTQALTSTSPRQIDLISAKDNASPNAFQVLLLDSDAKEVTGINTLAVDNHFADHRDHADNVTNRDDGNDRNDENNRDDDKRIMPQLLHPSERPQDRQESEEKGHDACPTLDGSNTPQSLTSQAPILVTPTPKPSRSFFRSLSSISASSQSMIMDIGMHADSISNAALQDDVGPSDSLLGAYDFDTTMTVMPDALAMDTLFGGESEQIQPLDMFSTGFDPTSAIDTPSSVHRETPKPLEQQQQQQPLFNDSLYNYSHILHSPAAEDVVASDGYDTFLEEGDGQPSTDVSNSAMDSLDHAPLGEQEVDMAVVDQNDKVAAMEPSVAGEASRVSRSHYD
ncbi:hypothetical protein BGZ99_003252 [Dissophora globulifera]|uniref:Uncharacterized protein n=1 Tax=Dissophora globulifera TaxID=979702 RepID=A0A9P6RMS8_9FUNG|nr:hypothetical protein BGZ99_003252 [Dissophora globulifera]